MTRTQAELLLLGALLLGAWLVFGADYGLPSSVTDRARGGGSLGDRPVDQGLGERAREMRSRLAAPRPQSPVRRNPFSFGDDPPDSAGGTHAAAVAVAAPEPAASRPEMRLSGIAEETGDDRPVRTAVISSHGQVVLAREGDRIFARFVVRRITADAVQLEDSAGGEVFTLVFK